MAQGMYFTPNGFHEGPVRRRDQPPRRGWCRAPAGRLYHVALETDGQIQIFDIWDSQEAFEAFGATRLPIMTEIGVDPGVPQVATVHNVLEG